MDCSSILCMYIFYFFFNYNINLTLWSSYVRPHDMAQTVLLHTYRTTQQSQTVLESTFTANCEWFGLCADSNNASNYSLMVIV